MKVRFIRSIFRKCSFTGIIVTIYEDLFLFD